MKPESLRNNFFPVPGPGSAVNGEKIRIKPPASSEPGRGQTDPMVMPPMDVKHRPFKVPLLKSAQNWDFNCSHRILELNNLEEFPRFPVPFDAGMLQQL
jgi:hypothetical protein